jgi:hypothetical protein
LIPELPNHTSNHLSMQSSRTLALPSGGLQLQSL